MLNLIVKDGGLCVSDDHLVTDADGAPCVCDSEDNECLVKIIPCFCDREGEARFITGEQAAIFWANRESGGAVIEINGVCYQSIGERLYSDINPSLILDAEGSTTHANCLSSPCTDQVPCPPCTGGFGFAVAPSDKCTPRLFTFCVGRSIVSASGFLRYKKTVSGEVRETITISWSQTEIWEAVGRDPHLISRSARVFYNKQTKRGESRFANASYSDFAVVSQGPSGKGVGWTANSIGTGAGVRFPDMTVTSQGGSVVHTGGDVGFGFFPNRLGCDFADYSGADGFGSFFVDSSSLNYFHSYMRSGFTALSNMHKGLTVKEFTIHVLSSRQFQYVGDEVDSVPSDNEICEDPRIATACNPDAIPQQVIYDLKTKPTWAKSMICQGNDEIYLLTIEVSDEDPVLGVLYLDQACDDGLFTIAHLCSDPSVTISIDPDLLTPDCVTVLIGPDRYSITTETTNEPPVNVVCSTEPCESWPVGIQCGGGPAITYDPDLRTPDGVTFLFNGNRYKPNSTTSTDTPSNVVWSPLSCPVDPCSVLVPNDPRCGLPEFRGCPQCPPRQVDDPIIDPNPPASSGLDDDIPGLGDLVKQSIALFGLNRLVGEDCPKCEKRRIVLNQYGNRIGRAILRRLGL